jgi:hypothetical protein
MKTLKNLICLVILLTVYSHSVSAQNLTELPQEKRDSILIATAKKIVLKYGPGYYNENKVPVIFYGVLTEKHTDNKKDIGRAQYGVLYYLDEEDKLKGFLVTVHIWADTGKPSGVMFGNGFGYNFDGDTSGLRSDNDGLPDLPIIPYEL